MVRQPCRRCWGRKKIEGIHCFLCLGKGSIELSQQQIEEHFRRFRRKNGPK